MLNERFLNSKRTVWGDEKDEYASENAKHLRGDQEMIRLKKEEPAWLQAFRRHHGSPPGGGNFQKERGEKRRGKKNRDNSGGRVKGLKSFTGVGVSGVAQTRMAAVRGGGRFRRLLHRGGKRRSGTAGVVRIFQEGPIKKKKKKKGLTKTLSG